MSKTFRESVVDWAGKATECEEDESPESRLSRFFTKLQADAFLPESGWGTAAEIVANPTTFTTSDLPTEFYQSNEVEIHRELRGFLEAWASMPDHVRRREWKRLENRCAPFHQARTRLQTLIPFKNANGRELEEALDPRQAEIIIRTLGEIAVAHPSERRKLRHTCVDRLSRESGSVTSSVFVRTHYSNIAGLDRSLFEQLELAAANGAQRVEEKQAGHVRQSSFVKQYGPAGPARQSNPPHEQPRSYGGVLLGALIVYGLLMTILGVTRENRANNPSSTRNENRAGTTPGLSNSVDSAKLREMLDKSNQYSKSLEERLNAPITHPSQPGFGTDVNVDAVRMSNPKSMIAPMQTINERTRQQVEKLLDNARREQPKLERFDSEGPRIPLSPTGSRPSAPQPAPRMYIPAPGGASSPPSLLTPGDES